MLFAHPPAPFNPFSTCAAEVAWWLTFTIYQCHLGCLIHATKRKRPTISSSLHLNVWIRATTETMKVFQVTIYIFLQTEFWLRSAGPRDIRHSGTRGCPFFHQFILAEQKNRFLHSMFPIRQLHTSSSDRPDWIEGRKRERAPWKEMMEEEGRHTCLPIDRHM